MSGCGDTRHIGKIQIHPRDPDLVYVAALGHAFGPNEERGVFRTRDGGRTWERVLYKSARAGSHDVSMDPTNPRILYAAIWQAQRYPHALISGGEECGIWRSTDGGDTWEEITRKPGLPTGLLGKIGVAASPGAAGTRLGADRGRGRGDVPLRRLRRVLGPAQRSSRCCGRAPGTTCTSPPTPRIRRRSTSRTTASGSRSTAARPSPRCRRRTATIMPSGSIPTTTGG